ncbi:MAG: hypothetical protein QOH06_3047 [Acidobacteriota bacterium]|jgi:hypothetical protein|nr:hypothetical protein [Acidobacteriota bacterium]
MKSLPISIALSLLFTLGAAHAAAHAVSPASPRKTDAHQLLRLAEAGLGDAVHAAEATQGRLDRAKPEQQPFWRAVDKMNVVLRRVRTGMMARDESFFRALEDGSAALGELRVVWARTGVADPGVSEGLRILSESYNLLRTGYGREAIRHRRGRGLTEAERQQFLRIQLAQQRFADLLKELQEEARRRGDEAMAAELRRMAIDAERIAAAQLTLNAYLNALMLGDAQRGEWTGNSQYAAPADRSDWQEAETVVEELYTEQEVGHVWALDLGTLPDTTPSVLSHFDEATELPDSLAAEADEIDPIEEQEAFYEEEMEEGADTDLEAIEEIVVVEDEAVEEEVVLEEGEAVEEGLVEAKAEAKTDEKPEVKPAEAIDPKKAKEPAPVPVKKKDSKKKSARPPS